MSIFDKLFGKYRRRKHREKEFLERMESQNYYQSLDRNNSEDDDFDFPDWDFKPTKLKDIDSIKAYVVSLCEQMIDISKEMDDVRREYKRLTELLNDVEIMENLQGAQKKQLEDVATNLSSLNKVRTECLNAEQKISDELFKLLQEYEDEMPDTIHRLMDNEKYLDAIRRDLNRLAAEKIEWSVQKHENLEEKEKLQKYSGILTIVFGVLALLGIIVCIAADITMLPVLFIALISTIVVAVMVIRSQECEKVIRQCDVNQNYVIALENRVKIRYVNTRNAIDYTCRRFNVVTARELTNRFEEYQDICKGREKFKQVNQDLEFYHNKLFRTLREIRLSEARFWMNNANAIIDPKEMVEVKHNLFAQRKRLRGQIEYNLKAISEIREEVEMYCDIMGEKTPQVRAILYKVEEVNRGII